MVPAASPFDTSPLPSSTTSVPKPLGPTANRARTPQRASTRHQRNAMDAARRGTSRPSAGRRTEATISNEAQAATAGRARGKKRTRLRQQEGPAGDSPSLRSRTETARDNEAAAFVASAGGWILDSEASSHIVRDRSRLEGYEPYVTQVKVADQQIVNTVGQGSLRVRSTVNGVTHTITFSDVLYIPTSPTSSPSDD
jgi:hypothetical protein